MKSSIIVSDPEILGGTPVFRGTRVPIRALFDYLQFSTIDEFLVGYPHISREMVNEVLAVIAKRVSAVPHRKRRETTA
ncbi:hypothetical protein GCM10023187_00880 [Nibrella viscosa]|uniref:DUF433 domain-containing protein n=1 Tax=Nibrella viscosa TaxID=1084524 RepID=A0ABP8JQY8_9BACT